MLRACQAIDAAIDWLSRWTLSVSGTVLLAVLLLGIALRYVFTESLPWATELPTLLFPIFVMAGIVLAAQHGQHVAVEFLLNLLPTNGRRVLLVLVNLLGRGELCGAEQHDRRRAADRRIGAHADPRRARHCRLWRVAPRLRPCRRHRDHRDHQGGDRRRGSPAQARPHG
jgi:hypothetical protein